MINYCIVLQFKVYEIQTPLTEINSSLNCDINKISEFQIEEENENKTNEVEKKGNETAECKSTNAIEVIIV